MARCAQPAAGLLLLMLRGHLHAAPNIPDLLPHIPDLLPNISDLLPNIGSRGPRTVATLYAGRTIKLRPRSTPSATPAAPPASSPRPSSGPAASELYAVSAFLWKRARRRGGGSANALRSSAGRAAQGLVSRFEPKTRCAGWTRGG